jgi:cytoskeletal protein CcmA (bactofilin family)
MLEAAESTVNSQKTAMGAPAPGIASGLKSAMEQATLGATMVVKGELSGAQAFYVDGRVEGSIHFPHHRVTIGRGAVVQASIEAREVVIMGAVTGNIDCGDRVDIRSEAVVTGDVVTQRISIDEGALVKGSVEVRKLGKSEHVDGEAKAGQQVASKPETSFKPVTGIPSAPPAEAVKAAAAAVPSSLPKSTFRVAGSKVLFEEHKK